MFGCRKIYLLNLIAMTAFAAGCSSPTSGITEEASIPPVPYCSTIQTYSVPTVTISGYAAFEWRILGNMYLADGSYMLTNDPAASGTYAATVNGHLYSAGTFNALATAITAGDTSVLVTRPSYPASVRMGSVSQTIKVSPATAGASITVTAGAGTFTTDKDGITMGAPLNPIRYAEIRVSDSAGRLVQCGETDGSGNYSVALPQNTGTYRIEIASRAFNAHNTAYIMRNPSGNAYYSISSTVDSAATTLMPILIAKASGSYEAGAFNILDQIFKAQEYLRTQTASCGSGPYQECVPFNAFAERYIVNTYWTPGLSPNVYRGSSSPISFYYNGIKQLYIGGGQNGNTTNSDMDHFDNSIIIHEYGHFIEDQFGHPDSPGGDHDGRSIIDPRLAWGEGWADFLQAAVLYPDGVNPVYRDTEGNIDCGYCTHVGLEFDLNLQDGVEHGNQTNDVPDDPGEGIFHEFSVARMLYQAILNGFQFPEIWANLNGSTHGMKGVNDHFKSMARFHKIQSTATGASDWSSISTQEKQYHNQILEYGTPLDPNPLTCDSTKDTVQFHIKGAGGNAYAYSDQFNNNDFYVLNHLGGAIEIKIEWFGGQNSDLDLYIYPRGYDFGWDYLARTPQYGRGVTGTKTLRTTLPAGQYMLNVNAYEGADDVGAPMYSDPTAYQETSYRLSIDGARACPVP